MNKTSQAHFDLLKKFRAKGLDPTDQRVEDAMVYVMKALDQRDGLVEYVQLAVQEYDSNLGISRGTINKLQELST